jgi:CheY-like chemotaxis protein
MGDRWFDVSAYRLGGEGSKKVAVLFNDISARKGAEAERERLLGQLREHDRRKDEFLATLAHELRNPLAPISSGLQVMRMAGAQGIIEQSRSMMERQLVQMTRLVDDLLDVSRLTTGKLELRRERVALRDVVAAALETSRPVIEHHGHELAIAVPDEPVVVDGDPIRLAQVVSNLLTNSAKYTRRGGHIRVSVARECSSAVVVVADDGVGIPTHMLESVFGMFTQVDRTLEKATGGLGIGLSLVKGLVEMHGGTIEARSEGEGKGSEFVVRLPLAAFVAQQSPPIDREANRVASAGLHRILVVDDNVDSADSLGQLLEMMGNEVRIAYDGEAGLEAARAFRPGVVLCDIGMPKVNGYETARRIRAEAWGKDIVLVALTGWSQEDDLQKSADAGFDHHLVKPVESGALLTLLAGVQPVTA